MNGRERDTTTSSWMPNRGLVECGLPIRSAASARSKPLGWTTIPDVADGAKGFPSFARGWSARGCHRFHRYDVGDCCTSQPAALSLAGPDTGLHPLPKFRVSLLQGPVFFFSSLAEGLCLSFMSDPHFRCASGNHRGPERLGRGATTAMTS